MGQSLSVINVHLVFSTKHRQKFIHSSFRNSLHKHLVGILQYRNCEAVAINSVDDHIHILFGLPRTLTLAALVQAVKVATAIWIKTNQPGLQGFQWQVGYGAFAVGNRDVARVVRYIANQEAHHRAVSWMDEYRTILTENAVAWDERYVWD